MSEPISVLVSQQNCCICFDQCSTGLKCECDHTMCHNCVAPYIESTSEDVGKLKDRHYVISCPVPRCEARPYSTTELLSHGGHGEALNKYVMRLIEACRQNEGGAARKPVGRAEVIPLLLDALNLKCSNEQCGAVLDPSPDGCAAVRCANCATYVCFLCFTTCPSSAVCHQHVRRCEYSPNPPDLFSNDAQRQPAHKRVRIAQLRQVLADRLLAPGTIPIRGLPYGHMENIASNEAGRQLKGVPQARQHLEAIIPNLKEVGISIDDVFGLSVLSEATVGPRPPKQPTGRRVPIIGNFAHGHGHGQGPLLQPAIGRYVPWWEVCLIFSVAALFLAVMVYVIFLLASVADVRKQTRHTASFNTLPGPAGTSCPVPRAPWELRAAEPAVGTCRSVDDLAEGVFLEESEESSDALHALVLWEGLVDTMVVVGTAGLYWVAVAASLRLCVYKRW